MLMRRVSFLKKLYSDYVIFVLKNEKYYVFKDDRIVIENLISKSVLKEKDINKIDSVNYIILDNLTILKKYETYENKFNYILKKQKLIEMLKR